MEGIRGCTALYIGSSYQNRTVFFHPYLWGSPREEVQMKMYVLNNTKIPEVITAKCFHKCHNNKQFIPSVYMFINHKMTHRYFYFRFTRHALQLHHVTISNYLHGYTRLCCQNLAYRQTEIKWSFFVQHLNSWFAGTHENWQGRIQGGGGGAPVAPPP